MSDRALVVILLVAGAAPTHTLRVHISGLRGARGALVCRLFPNRTGFPAKPAEKMEQRSEITIDATTKLPTASCVFSGLADGTYAVTAFHDENGNGTLDTNFIGIPVEGVGVSNNHRGFGPPSWEDSRFPLDRDLSIDLSLRY